MSKKTFSPEILYEDNHLIAINKPSGMLVQGDKTGDIPLVDHMKNFIKVRDKKPGNVYMGLPHRLDRPTSGILLFCKTSKSLSRLNKMFQEKKVQKTYWAVTEKPPKVKTGTLEDWLAKSEKKNKSRVLQKEWGNAKWAKLKYKYLLSSDNYHLIEVYPQTGRHHQIRVQLSNIGCTIKGDLKYGAKRSNKDESIHLHAVKIDFVHPVKNIDIKIIAPPNDKDAIWKFFSNKLLADF